MNLLNNQTFEMNAKYLLKNNLVDYTQVAGIIYE